MIKSDFRKPIRIICFILLFIVLSYNNKAQIVINGPTCVIPGTTTYQYNVDGKLNTDSTATICIAGGTLNSGTNCVTVATLPYMILVVWNDSVFNRKVQVSSYLGSNSLIVSGTTQLNGSVINDSDQVQLFDSTQVVYIFHCGDATGGSCNPTYIYQWQSSENQLNWTNIGGATGRNLQYSGSIQVTTFFRRVTTETQSNTIAYSGSGQLNTVYQ